MGIPRRYKIIAACVWIFLLGSGLVYIYINNIALSDVVAALYNSAQENPWAAFTYVFLYAIRPLTFFPAMWLTIASGSLFGFVPGVLLTMVGENLSAAAAYAIARFFRAPPEDSEEAMEELSAFRRTLQEQALPTVIVLRAAYLPFDLVNFGCGLLRVPWWPYVIGTFIGILPPMITFVSFGATVDFEALISNPDDFDPGQLFNSGQAMITAGLLAASAVIAWFAHQRRKRLSQQAG